jgi:glucose-6-phosphate isomerase
MFNIDHSYLHNKHDENSNVYYKHRELFDERSEAIWDFLNSTDQNTKYYKVLHPRDPKTAANEFIDTSKYIQDHFDHFVFVGMGGAFLNPKMVHELVTERKVKQSCHFINTTDPSTFNDVIENIEISRTAFIFISNSANTVETISLYLAFKNLLDQHSLSHKKHICFVLSNPNGTLTKIADQEGYRVVDYGKDIGGRFSTFASGTVFCGNIMGVDMERYLESYANEMKKFWSQKQDYSAIKLATKIFLLKKRVMPLISYAKKLATYLEWYCQTLSESLGKNNMGYAPFFGIGPQEQHTLFEYYLDGSPDIFLTFFNITDTKHNHLTSISEFAPSLSNTSLKQINDNFFNASVEYFKKRNTPLRTIVLGDLSTENYSSLLAHNLVELVFLSLLHQVHPFEQPSMDQCKKFAYTKYFGINT